jgi:ABC-type transport system involved in cytochrome bd biosynthesis fused ATPase/permease subunit
MRIIKLLQILKEFIGIRLIVVSAIFGLLISLFDLLFYASISKLFSVENEYKISDYDFSFEEFIIFLFTVLVFKNILYLFNLMYIRGYANDVEKRIVNILQANRFETFKNDRFGDTDNINEDVYYSLYITKFVNNVFTPLVKLFPELSIVIVILFFLSINYPQFLLSGLFLIIVFVPVVLLYNRKSNYYNKLIINSLDSIISSLKFVSTSRNYFFINFKNRFEYDYINQKISDNKSNWQKLIFFNNLNRPIVEILMISIFISVIAINNSVDEVQIFIIVFLRLCQQIITISTNFSNLNNHKEIIEKVGSLKNIFNKSITKYITHSDGNSIQFFEKFNNGKNGIFKFTGESGIGKSTSLEFACFINKIQLLNQSTNAIKTIKVSNYKFIPQSPLVFESIKSDLMFNNINSDDFIKFCSKIKILKINKIINNKDLSGGELIRYSILKNLFLFKDFNLILDEPTTGLDNINREKVINLILQISKKKKIIVITHDNLFENSKKLIVLKATISN